MIYRIAAGIMLLFGGVALISVGVAYAAYAVYSALLPAWGAAAAAALAACALLVLPILGWAFFAIKGRGRRRSLFRNLPPSGPENVAIAFLSGLAKDKPLIGLALASLLGAATAFLRRKNK